LFQELSKSLQSATGKLYAVKCDISNESEVLAAFKWVEDNLGGVDILINNAAVLTDTSLTGELLSTASFTWPSNSITPALSASVHCTNF
jgi:NAD(P)-dependent dehydrogenase (short-subunit alcohol dehydrogenase family)